MKKIGIEKLIRYLLESKGDEYKEEYYERYRDIELEQNIDSLSELRPFVKWLVENDKIDFDGIQNVFYRNKRYKEHREYSDYESLLMLLAISDEPIEFLTSILKNV